MTAPWWLIGLALIGVLSLVGHLVLLGFLYFWQWSDDTARRCWIYTPTEKYPHGWAVNCDPWEWRRDMEKARRAGDRETWDRNGGRPEDFSKRWNIIRRRPL